MSEPQCPHWLIALGASVLLACSNAHELDLPNPVYLEIDGAVGGGQGDGGAPEDDTSADSGAGPGGGPSAPTGGGDGPGAMGPGPGPGAPSTGSCNPASCAAGSTMFGEFSGCCVEGACGYQIGDQCVPQNTPGGPHSACPDVSLGGFINLTGCCRPDGTCGVTVVMTLPLGCTTEEVANTLFASVAGGGGFPGGGNQGGFPGGGQPAQCN